jgi:hypothetical protein
MIVPHRLGADRRAHQVDVDHQPEVVEAHLGEALVAQDAGVVDQDVDPAPARHDLIDHRGDGGLVGDRGRDASASPPAATISAATRSAASWDRSLTTTLAPWPREKQRMARPRPPPAPVTIATRPSTASNQLPSLPRVANLVPLAHYTVSEYL